MPVADIRANAIRALSMDAVQHAGSGHPGMPMGMAEIAVALWAGHMKHNPLDPHWPNRDRFVLSTGHGSMLLYSLLHLTGYPMPMDELKRFRQLHSKTPGHPEVGYTPGVETSTGPLGQGLANAVGLALAEQLLAAEFNRDGFPVVDHHTYVFAGDGCLMEGISHEVCSLAGTWKLGKLIVFFDDNGISIDGHVKSWFTDDTPARFRAYGWNVIEDVDGHSVKAVDGAIRKARASSENPTLICCRTVIGKGLGERESAAADVLQAVAAVSCPFDMSACGHHLARGFNRLYTRHFLRTLKHFAGEKLSHHPALFDERRMGCADTLYAFDDIVTAPLHGFASAADYWRRASTVSSAPMATPCSVPIGWPCSSAHSFS